MGKRKIPRNFSLVIALLIGYIIIVYFLIPGEPLFRLGVVFGGLGGGVILVSLLFYVTRLNVQYQTRKLHQTEEAYTAWRKELLAEKDKLLNIIYITGNNVDLISAESKMNVWYATYRTAAKNIPKLAPNSYLRNHYQELVVAELNYQHGFLRCYQHTARYRHDMNDGNISLSAN